MIIVTHEQRTPDWYAARRGLPTASEFGSIITPAYGEYAKAADTYINELIDELQRPEESSAESFQGTKHTRNGTMLEPEALGVYAFDSGLPVRSVGLVLSDCRRFGCSPDSLVGNDGLVQVKCPDGKKFVSIYRKWIKKKEIPSDYIAQCHGELIVTGRAWNDLMIYCPKYDPIVIRVTPDKFTDRLREHLDRFHNEYVAALAVFDLTHPGESLEAAA